MIMYLINVLSGIRTPISSVSGLKFLFNTDSKFKILGTFYIILSLRLFQDHESYKQFNNVTQGGAD